MIRRATVSDAEAIAALRDRAWRAAYSAYVPIEVMTERSLSARIDDLRARLAAGRPRTLVSVDEGGVPAGFVTVGESRDADTDGDGELYALYVEPALVGTGIGRALAIAGEDELRAAGFATATLWTFEANAPARRFYERGGWTVDHRPFDPGRWSWAPSVRYRKAPL